MFGRLEMVCGRVIFVVQMVLAACSAVQADAVHVFSVPLTTASTCVLIVDMYTKFCVKRVFLRRLYVCLMLEEGDLGGWK